MKKYTQLVNKCSECPNCLELKQKYFNQVKFICTMLDIELNYFDCFIDNKFPKWCQLENNLYSYPKENKDDKIRFDFDMTDFMNKWRIF